MKRTVCLLLLCSLLLALLAPQVMAVRSGAVLVALEPEDEKEPPEPLPETQPVFDPIWPVDTSYEISCIYYYQSGLGHSTRYGNNNSLDIAGKGNALAVEDGVIETVDYLYNSFGNYIVILHKNGGRSLYAHLARTYVQEGDEVKKGDIIAVVGSSGKSAGVHLHYEYSLADPWLTFFKDKYYEQLVFEQNCYFNNKYYNDSPYICQWLTDNYVQREEYFYWNGVTPELEQVDPVYPTPFWATLTAKQPVTAYQWIDFNPVGTIAPGTECIVEQVYKSGWCRVLLRWEEAKTGYLTVYLPTDTFFDPTYTPISHTGLSDTPGYMDKDMAVNVGTMAAETDFVEVGRSEETVQIITTLSKDVRRLMWVVPTGDKLEGVSIGSSFTATISDLLQENLLVIRDDAVRMDDPLSVKNTAWAFVYQENGYYTISDPLTEEVLTAQADGSVTMEPWNGNDAALWMLCGTNIDKVLITAKGSAQILEFTADGALRLGTYRAADHQIFMLDCEMIYDLRYDGNGGSADRSTESGLHYQQTVTVNETAPTPVSYTLRFDANGGTVNIKDKTLTPVFTAWNSRQDGSGNTYHAGDILPILGTTTLYAQWERLALGELPAPVREGYEFDGWFTEAEGGIPMSASSVLNHNTTLYAHWTQKTTDTGLILVCVLAALILLVVFVLLLFFVQKKKNAERQARLSARHKTNV